MRLVGDSAILVEFGDSIDQIVHDEVLALDRAITYNGFPGLVGCIPAYASLLVRYDPCTVEPRLAENYIRNLMQQAARVSAANRLHRIPVCYDEEFASDLHHVAAQLALTPQDVITHHLSCAYRVYMYGFAPGFAYLGKLPSVIQLPRRAEPRRSVPAGSVIIAGVQCIVTTLEMPSGWWIIGRSPTRILRPESHKPFLFDVGDELSFWCIGRAEYEELLCESSGS
jgi:inhibitor of KinA